MKNNKFKKATSIVMSAVVAGMAMGNGACYAAQTKLDEAKKLVKRLTTSQIVTDGRDFVNKVSNRDVLFFTAGSCTVAAIALVAAYHGYPNGLKDLAKHIVKVDVEGGEVKLLALHLKNYKFKEETSDAFLLISADSRKAVAASEEAQAGGNAAPAEDVNEEARPQEAAPEPKEEKTEEKKEEGEEKKAKAVEPQGAAPAPAPEAGEMLRENFVYKVASVGESEFRSWMVTVPQMFSSEPVVHGKLEFVTIDASCLFGTRRNVEGDKIGKDFANGLISDIEGLAQLSKRNLGFFSFGNGKKVTEDVKKDVKKEEKKESKRFVVGAYAAEPIAAGTEASKKVKVRFAEDDESTEPMELELAENAAGEIKVKGPVQVIVETAEYEEDGGKGIYTFKFGGKEFKNVKEAAAEN